MTLPPMHGLRKPTSPEQRDMGQSDFPLAAKGISVPGKLIVSLTLKISGNTTPLLIPGHRKPISGEQQDNRQPDFPLAAKGISEPALAAVTLTYITRIFGNILPRAPRPTEM